jgi:hypothetical protein
MENSMKRSMWLALPLMLAACGDDGEGSDDFVAEVEDAEEALSDNGGDPLFSIAVSEAKDVYDIAELSLAIAADGADAVDIVIEMLEDADEDGKLGSGDSARGVEPATNLLGLGDIGTEYTVTLTHTPAEGDPVELFSGSWTAQ